MAPKVVGTPLSGEKALQGKEGAKLGGSGPGRQIRPRRAGGAGGG